METDEMELDTIGDRKTALFVIISDTDDTFNFVVSIYNEGGKRALICRFIGAAERGHKHFSVRLVRVFDIVKGFA